MPLRPARLAFLVSLAVPSFLPGCAASTESDERAASSRAAPLEGVDLAIGIGRVPTGGLSDLPGFVDRAFYVQSLGSRCFDFGAQTSWAVGSPVFLYTCNGSAAQRVRVKEIVDGSHDVELRVEAQYCIGARMLRAGQRPPVVRGEALELQTCNGSPTQRFALDGDSILLGAQESGRVTREYAIRPQNLATANRTPLVVGPRETSDGEYFRFASIDGSSAVPTSGFVTVSVNTLPGEPSDHWLAVALQRGWGTVIEIDGSRPFPLTDTQEIPAGVTLRGYRKHRNEGATVTFTGASGRPAVWVHEDNVRVTGLRFVGPGTGTDNIGAIRATTAQAQRILIDHLEITNWSASGVTVDGDDDNEDTGDPKQPQASCDPNPPAAPRATNVRALRNYIHDNRRLGGYGIATGNGAFILAQGNVEYRNAHSITSDPWRRSGYLAYDNLFLSPYFDSDYTSNQDMDVHGGDDAGPDGSYTNGISGDYFDIGWNTFLGTNHYNFNQRGTPCRFTLFHDNIARSSEQNAYTTLTTAWLYHQAPPTNPAPAARATFVYGNQFNATDPDPMSEIAAGDFDGDHIDDVFVGTGNTWWFSSGGATEWRLLNRMPEHAGELRFGDFDGDGRTDVLALHNGSIDVSWAGISPWQTINTTSANLADLAVGDFDGDHLSDLFLATGHQWFIAPGARTWQPPFVASSYRVSDLRFGDFNSDGRTDVLGALGNTWQFVAGGTSTWNLLRSALTFDLSDVAVADFDGDGIADVARRGDTASGSVWQYSARGRSPFLNLRNDTRDLANLSIGNFDGHPGADVLFWNADNHFAIAPGPSGAIAEISLHPMQ